MKKSSPSDRPEGPEPIGFDDLESLIQMMAGERSGTPPVHGVFSPDSQE